MANTTIQLKKSSTSSAKPVVLEFGELAINYADGKLFYKNTNSQIAEISGEVADSFGTVNANGVLIIADTPGDILTIEAGDNITIVGDAINDKIIISAAPGGSADIGPVFTQANTARNHANAAFEKANAANVLAFNTGAGANAYAASVGAAGNNYTISVGAAANGWANTVASASAVAANTYAGTVGAASNTIATAAFSQANTATTNAGNAFGQANTARTHANAAFGQANTARDQANTAGTDAVNAFGQANTSRTHANAAFGQANTATTNAGNAFGQANTATTNAGNAFGQANTARNHANAAFEKANAANVLAFNTGAGANAYTVAVGTAGNNYTITVAAAANGWANTISATRVAASNAYAETVGAAANTLSLTRATAANAWTNTVFGFANSKFLANASGSLFNGDLLVSGNLALGTTIHTRLWSSSANVLSFFTSDAEDMRIDPAGNVGIGTTSPTYRLEVAGSFAAQTKSFLINHQSEKFSKLAHGSLEGPENGIYYRGKTTEKTIELPEYWSWLIDEETITVNLTPIGCKQDLFVKEIKDNKIIIGGSRKVEYYYTVFAERKDVSKLVVEY
jgi:hypothetical protein